MYGRLLLPLFKYVFVDCGSLLMAGPLRGTNSSLPNFRHTVHPRLLLVRPSLLVGNSSTLFAQALISIRSCIFAQVEWLFQGHLKRVVGRMAEFTASSCDNTKGPSKGIYTPLVREKKARAAVSMFTGLSGIRTRASMFIHIVNHIRRTYGQHVTTA